ncbi:ribosome small subunit-dependent GTPase A [Fibrobacter sp. UWB1]|uniref:ribosome small subunit-dependent GTPase A n=1 Tax=Fibrobacter sp. UWB1 TaxID=1964355 RepID=UPI000B528A87|nr:ribosome small subunit-dependent GTPase A [Fibrobacter sp. UWB1]OWV25225.1 ribosome small subunit-dependent GTPase A [Fibrobacter sp. UWB1]
MLDSDFEDEREPRRVRPTRRDHRSRRIDVMREMESGVVDERPVKERFSREFKNPRIKKIKDPLEKIDEKDCVEGLVVEVHRRTCEVRLDSSTTPNGFAQNDTLPTSDCLPSTVTAMYRATTSKALGEFPAVGDRVLLGQVNEDEDSGEGVGSQKYCVVRVLPRKSELKRPGPRDSFRRKLTLAANIDQVVIVASVTQPEFNYGFMDRFLLAANLNNLPFVLVLTKMDLLPNGEADLTDDIRDFMSIVDKVIPVSVKSGVGLERLREELLGKSSVFSGQSGVGKSTLVNALVPGAELETGAVRERDGKGRHTTTSSSLFDFPGGGYVIDTPGIRSIGLANGEDDMDGETLAKIFPGFFEGDLFTCKYSNCKHLKEPGCSVREAVESGKLSRARYASYLRILNSRN